VDAAGGAAIVVGHSMGGMSITAAAELRPDRISRLVYLAAFLPKDGESVLVLEERNPDPRVPPHIQPDKENFVARIDLDHVVDLFYHDCPDEDVALAKARIRPQSFLPLTAPVRITAGNFGRVPRAYFECTADRALVPPFQQAMYRASPCNPVVRLDAGHSPFFSKPALLARELSALASHG
jgi:pimeloyl-ACP methyl ester carboxylesterase